MFFLIFLLITMQVLWNTLKGNNNRKCQNGEKHCKDKQRTQPCSVFVIYPARRPWPLSSVGAMYWNVWALIWLIKLYSFLALWANGHSLRFSTWNSNTTFRWLTLQGGPRLTLTLYLKLPFLSRYHTGRWSSSGLQHLPESSAAAAAGVQDHQGCLDPESLMLLLDPSGVMKIAEACWHFKTPLSLPTTPALTGERICW